MATTRTYSDRCGVARALDVVGERWSLLIVRELLLGPKRYSDIRAGLPKATPNVLSERLRELEANGILRRRTLGPPARARVYELTRRGQELEPVILALGRWGSATAVAPNTEMSTDSHALALRTLFSSELAADLHLSVNLLLEDDQLAASVTDGVLRLTRGSDPRADTAIGLDRPTLRALLWEGMALSHAAAAGAARVEGDPEAAQTFLSLFPRPAPEPGEP